MAKPDERFDVADTTEIWRAVVGYEDVYEVSSFGRVRSLERTVFRKDGHQAVRRGRVLKLKMDGLDGHLRITLHRAGIRDDRKIHILVLETFVSTRPDGLVGCHNDGDPGNNHVGNLRWDTQLENMRDIKRHGRNFQLNKTHCIRDHEFTPENTNIQKGTGARMCKRCQQQSSREAYQRKLARLRALGIETRDPNLLYRSSS